MRRPDLSFNSIASRFGWNCNLTSILLLGLALLQPMPLLAETETRLTSEQPAQQVLTPRLDKLRLSTNGLPNLPLPTTINLFERSGRFVGQVTKMPTEIDIYVTARHILEIVDKETLGVILAGLEVFDVYSPKGELLDISLIVPEPSNPQQVNPASYLWYFESLLINSNSQPNDFWASHQTGSSGEFVYEQIASGRIDRDSDDQKHIFLTEDLYPITSEGSSGAIVWSVPYTNIKRPWHPIGLVECIQLGLNGSQRKIRALSFKYLAQSKITKTTFEKIHNSPLISRDPLCQPVGRRRGAGGN